MKKCLFKQTSAKGIQINKSIFLSAIVCGTAQMAINANVRLNKSISMVGLRMITVLTIKLTEYLQHGLSNVWLRLSKVKKNKPTVVFFNHL